MTSETTRIRGHAEQLGALGHAARLTILRHVVQGDPAGTPAGEIQAKLEIPASTLTHHLERLASAGQLAAYKHDGFWQCMDTPRDKALLEDLWQRGRPPWKVWA